MPQYLDGKKLATAIKLDLAAKIRPPHQPHLAVILVGNHAPSQIYVNHKRTYLAACGIKTSIIHLPQETTMEKVMASLQSLNTDPEVHGILVQLPLPPQLDEREILSAISLAKDVDGLHQHHLGQLACNLSGYRPCTPRGVIELLEHYAIPMRGQHAVVVGASNIVGKPMALELLHHEATVTLCHIATQDLASFVKRADILVVGIGKPDVVKSSWIKPGAVVVDIGINRLPDGKIVGDIDAEQATQAQWITPVPGGVGPMTIAMLAKNTYQAYLAQS